MATIELGVAGGAFAEFLSSLVSVGTEEKTVAVEPGTCTGPDSRTIDSGTQEKSATADCDSEQVEDSSSQQIAQVFVPMVQSVPQAPIVGTFSSESAGDEPAQVAHATGAKGASVAGDESAEKLPDLPVESTEVALDTKNKPETSFSKEVNLAQEVGKSEPNSSRVETPTSARHSDGQTHQVATDSTRVQKISPKYSSDQSFQSEQPVLQAVVEQNSLTLRLNDQTFRRSRNENSVAAAAIGHASVKGIESEISSTPIKDSPPAQHNEEKRGEPFSQRTAFVHPQITPAQIATTASGESVPSGMRVSPRVTHETAVSRNAGTAQEMQVALDTGTGKVHIRAELGKDDRVSAIVRAEHKETGAILAEQAPILERALAEKNIALGSFQVAGSTTSFGQSSNHSTPYRGQFERFSAATSGGSSEVATREQESYEPEERKLSVRV